MKQNYLAKKWISKGMIRAITGLLVVVLIVLSVCIFNETSVPAQPLHQLAEGRSHMSAFQTLAGETESGFVAEYPDGNNGIHLNLKESDKFSGEEDSETAQTPDPDGITQGISQNDSSDSETLSENTPVTINDENAENSSEYFYTTIDESEILTDVSYSFSIIHLQPELPVIATLVTVNETEINNFQGRCRLSQGENKIGVEVTYQKPDQTWVSQKRIYFVRVELEDITITTSLKDGVSVNQAEFSFTATAKRGDTKVPLTAELNGEKLVAFQETEEINQYSGELVEGTNRITLTAQDELGTKSVSYQVEYKPDAADDVPDIVDPEGEDPSLTAPRLETDLVDGSTITGNTLSFYIRPFSYQGERIRGQNVVVTCNDAEVDFVWDDSTTTSYRVDLQEGENRITVTPTDVEGYSLTFPYTVYCSRVESGESLGHVTLSVEATTVGLGNIIEATQVEIFEGVNAAKMLTDLLGEYGYDYSSSGSIDSGFYLSSIQGSGLVQNPSVPSDLEERLLAEEDSEYDPAKYSSDSLGEFDFCKGSGWMYSVNGHYPNYGFSDCYPHDGDVIRIRFTLYYGKDINGGYAMGDGDDANWGDW